MIPLPCFACIVTCTYITYICEDYEEILCGVNGSRDTCKCWQGFQCRGFINLFAASHCTHRVALLWLSCAIMDLVCVALLYLFIMCVCVFSLVPSRNYAREKLRLVTFDVKLGPEVAKAELIVWSRHVCKIRTVYSILSIDTRVYVS